jgi:hypothetical protein
MDKKTNELYERAIKARQQDDADRYRDIVREVYSSWSPTPKKIPPKPKVKQPPAWTWASQELMGTAMFAAKESLAEQMLGDRPAPKGFAAISADMALEHAIIEDPALKIEFYERAVHFIDRQKPRSGWSTMYGASVDRAHARLWLWLKLFADY